MVYSQAALKGKVVYPQAALKGKVVKEGFATALFLTLGDDKEGHLCSTGPKAPPVSPSDEELL